MATPPFSFPVAFGTAPVIPPEPVPPYTGPVLPPLTWTPSPSGNIGSAAEMVSIHTAKGTQLYQFLPEHQIDLMWTRDLRDVSRAEMTVATTDELLSPDSRITPWLHWMSVWDDTGQYLLWTGPVQIAESNRNTTKISARDVTAYFTRTRCPITKRWEAADPADVAEELLAAMIEQKGLQIRSVVRHDPLGDRFDYQARFDETMLDANISDLVGVGLYWSVVSGIPILGPAPRKPIAALSEDDFMGDGLTLVRDGSDMFNDVLLRMAGDSARAKVQAGGLSLQTIVNIDSMFGVSNANRAVKQYARYTGKVRDTVVAPGDAVLHPDAPISIDQLIPSVRITVEAFGLLELMEVTSMQKTSSEGYSSVGITIDTVNDELPELLDLPPSQAAGL